MRLPEDDGFPVLPRGEPTRDLLLAQALDACIAAERSMPGSSDEIVDRQPAWARSDLRRLVGLAGSLDAAASNAIMSNEFRVAARRRLIQRIGGDPGIHGQPSPHGAAPPPAGASTAAGPNPAADREKRFFRRRKTFWAARAAAAVFAAAAAVTATLTASASALPGEPLYTLKQAREELGMRLAPDDQERALALLGQADARLDETARLLRLGRTVAAAETTLRYDQILDRAMAAYVVTTDDAPPSMPPTGPIATRLSLEQDQLQSMLQSAPSEARADLRQALVTTERERALVADPRTLERALRGSDRSESKLAAAVPTMTVEDAPTEVPSPVAEVAARRLPALGPMAPMPQPAPLAVDAPHDDAIQVSPLVAQVAGGEHVPTQPRPQNTTLINSEPRPARPAATENQATENPATENPVPESAGQHAEQATVNPLPAIARDQPARAADHLEVVLGPEARSPRVQVAQVTIATAKTAVATPPLAVAPASAERANTDAARPGRDNAGDARSATIVPVAVVKPQTSAPPAPAPAARPASGTHVTTDAHARNSDAHAPSRDARPASSSGDRAPASDTHTASSASHQTTGR